MPVTDLRSRPFVPGTTGWTCADLDDPNVERAWLQGRYEIVEGVLTQMPPAYLTGGEALYNLIRLVDDHRRALGVKARFAVEVDIVIGPRKIARADAAMLLAAQIRNQASAARRAGRRDPRRTRILTPPALIIESVSPGHEDHDEATKRQWYADFGVDHYWVLDGFSCELHCLRLEKGAYITDVRGRSARTIRPTLFPDLIIPLKQVWGDE